MREVRSPLSVVDIVPDWPMYIIQSLPVEPTSNEGGGDIPPPVPEVVPEGVKRVGIPTDGSDGAGIGVVVLDSGIDINHPDLAVAPQRFDVFGGDCNDTLGHGTHVAGIIGALANGAYVVGVAPKATIYCAKAADQWGGGTDSNLIAALDWVYQNRQTLVPAPRVVNMSLGRGKRPGDMTGPLRAAITKLYQADIIVVAAAGNDPRYHASEWVPAGFPEVLAVASTTATQGNNSCLLFSGAILADTASAFTSDGKLDSNNIGVTISAPGEDHEDVTLLCMIRSVGTLSLKAGGSTTRLYGTSMSAPHVSGVVARILQKGYANTVEGVRLFLRGHADRMGIAPLDSPAIGYNFDGEREGIAQAPF